MFNQESVATKYFLKVSFKNVNQGDCIIVEWYNDQGELEVGLIDSNFVSSEKETQPSVSYLKELKSKRLNRIKFIILSHPHTDHYSGLKSILTYVYERFEIGTIFHTSFFQKHFFKETLKKKLTNKQAIDFLNLFISGEDEAIALAELFKIFRALKKVKGTKITWIVNDYEISLNSTLKLKFLAPMGGEGEEMDEFFQKGYERFKERSFSEKLNNPDANLLSTVVQLRNSEFKWQVLLTSDVENKVLARILKQNKQELGDNKLIAFQIPHHGSEKNFNKLFAEKMITKDTATFISVGNNRYGHPDGEVLKSYSLLSKKVHLTNKVGEVVNNSTSDRVAFLKSEVRKIRTKKRVKFIDYKYADEEFGEKILSIQANGDYNVLTKV